MSYNKATDVLPDEILSLIQNYIQGECIYNPKKECNRKPWGETTKGKKETSNRNLCVYKEYQEDLSIKTLLKCIFYLLKVYKESY
ncbi:CD3324 family protein [Clostridium sp.]|uniref:CD3324 family protein n=1 Tax=Clostridium sp. TaxID=1506 RepID=UPI002FC7A165